MNIGDYKLIKISDIDTSDRLRPIDPLFVDALASSIVRDGLLNPIDICQLPKQASGLPYKLVAGGHRVSAFFLLASIAEKAPKDLTPEQLKIRGDAINFRLNHLIEGEMYIPSVIRSNALDERRSREIAENLFKADLKPLERANFIGEMVEIEKRRSGFAATENILSVAASSRWNKDGKKMSDDASDIVSEAFGFNERVAEKLGLNPRTVYRDLALLRLSPIIINRLQSFNSAVLENAAQLKSLTKLGVDDAINAIEKLYAGYSFKDAMSAYLTKPNQCQTPTQKREAAFIGAWVKMSNIERAAMMEFLTGKEPEGYKILKGAN